MSNLLLEEQHVSVSSFINYVPQKNAGHDMIISRDAKI